MSIFELPTDLTQVTHFTVPEVRPWGGSRDAAFKEQLREAASIRNKARDRFTWFVFFIRCVVGESRNIPHQTPDVENIPKLIVDTFTDLLYPDDNLSHVRGIQVEAEWGPDEDERTEVWIYGRPKEE